MVSAATPARFSSTQMMAGFRAYYKEEGLTDKGLMVCMKVGDSGALDQCMVSALADDQSLESAGDCVEATQTAVPDAYQKVGDKWMMASADKQNYAAGKQFCADNGGVMARMTSSLTTPPATMPETSATLTGTSMSPTTTGTR